MATKVTRRKVEKIRDAIAANLGVEPEALEINMAWDWPGEPTPTILAEGIYDYENGGEGWALFGGWKVRDLAASLGLMTEPYASYALCVYPLD